MQLPGDAAARGTIRGAGAVGVASGTWDVWSPWGESPFPTLSTERLILREVVMADTDDVLAFRGDAEVQRYNLVPMRDRREATSLIRTMQGWYLTHYAIQWGITLRDENRVLGLCGLHAWNRHQHRALVGYDLAQSHWRQGIASEAMQAVLRFGFETMQLHCIGALTAAENARSIRLLQRLGFTLDAQQREGAWDQVRRFNTGVIYSLTRTAYDAQTPTSSDPQG